MAAERPKMKSSKPLMEKRRRARINDSLMQLKTLVLDALNKNNSRHSKLEKADILEMTVRYLRTIQRQQISASASSDPTVIGQYRSGYAQCMNEVTHYLGSNASASDAAPELRTRLLGHLANMVSPQQQQVTRTTVPVQQQSPVSFQIAPTNIHQQQQISHTIEGANIVNSMVPPVQVITHVQQQASPAAVPVRIAPAPGPEGARTERSFTLESNGQPSPAVQTNSAQVVQSVPVGVPSATLSSGEITVVLPPEALPNGQLPTHFIPVYAPNSAAILSPTQTSNIPATLSAPCHVSLSSPRAASAVPAMSPTGPQSSLTIPAQHAQATHAPTQVAYCVPVQTKLMAPPVREHNMQHHQIEPAAVREQILATDGQCVAKSDPMWRPW